MGQLVDNLGSKSPGQLIRSTDWNALVAAVENVEESLAQRMDDLTASLDGRVSDVTSQIEGLNSAIEDVKSQLSGVTETTRSQFDALNEKIKTLDEQFASLDNRAAPIQDDQYRVTIESERVHYAIGELAELTARVTDSNGNHLDLSDADNRPWVDFVTVLGRFKPVEGFENLGGSGDKAISVQVDEHGIAKVCLKSDHTEGFTDDAENEAAAFLRASLRGHDSCIADTVLKAAMPGECSASGVFGAISVEYDRSDSSFRNYVDAWYVHNLQFVGSGSIARPARKWRDHTTAVIAIVKAPDSSRATNVNSIQIAFRDWITPWICLDYLANLKEQVADVKARLGSRITSDYSESASLVTDAIVDTLRGKGVLGKQREYAAIRSALDALQLSSPPPFLPALLKAVRGMLDIQRTQGHSTAASPDDDHSIFKALNEILVRPQSRDTSADDRISEAAQSIETLGSAIAELKSTVRFMEGRFEASLSEGGELQRIRANLKSLEQQVEVLQALDVADVQGKMDEFQLIGIRLDAFEKKISEIAKNDASHQVEVTHSENAATEQPIEASRLDSVEQDIAHVSNQVQASIR